MRGPNTSLPIYLTPLWHVSLLPLKNWGCSKSYTLSVENERWKEGDLRFMLLDIFLDLVCDTAQ
jgi:hypothetical protein